MGNEVGMKFDQGKLRFTLLPWEAVTEIVKVLEVGSKKYAPDNWQVVDNAKQRYTDASFRHLTAWMGGETHDPETGIHHLAHTGCNILFLLWFELNAKQNP